MTFKLFMHHIDFCSIIIMLDGPTNYHAWSQNITIFPKGCKLWRYVTVSISKPVPNPKSKATIVEDASKTAVRTYVIHLLGTYVTILCN